MLSFFSQTLELMGLMGPPLMLASVVALALMCERFWFFWRLPLSREEVRRAWREGEAETLEAMRSPLALLARSHLENASASWESRVEATESRLSLWLGKQRGPLTTLRLIAEIAPLLGLTGTVLGLVKVFRVIQASERMVDPSMLAGGIWEALLTTVVGMLICIPVLIGLRVLDGQMARIVAELRDLQGWLRLHSADVAAEQQAVGGARR